MKIKCFLLSFFLCLAFNNANANMASPKIDETPVGSAISSKDIHVLSEYIRIQFSNKFSFAEFTVEYTIRSPKNGVQVPLIFYAKNYDKDVGLFDVKLDGQPISVLDFSDTSSLNVFIDKYKNDFKIREGYLMMSFDSLNALEAFALDDSKYFEVDIDSGIHKIEVRYRTYAGIYNGPWVQESFVEYALRPAKYWKSFQNLKIEIIQGDEVLDYSTNLGPSQEGAISKVNTWIFDTLPADDIVINYRPPISGFAQLLINVSPYWIAFIVASIFAFFHWWWIVFYRRKHPKIWLSIATVAGALIIPAIFCVVYVFSYPLIDFFIGNHASGRSAYMSIAIFFYYPIKFIFYLILSLAIDLIYRYRLKKKNIN